MTDGCDGTPKPLDAGDLGPWLDVPRDEAVPFVHRFETSGGKYVYDANTRRIIRVSPVVWDIVEEYGGQDERRLVERHSSDHGEGQVKAAIACIKQTRDEKGIFLSFRPTEVLLPTGHFVREKLDECREQMILCVTEDCNFRCSYCVFGGTYPNFPLRSAKAMEWDVARRAIDEFLAHSRQSKSRVISFYGGEPLLNLPLIRQCVSYVKSKQPPGEKVRFATTTNGSLLKGEAAAFLGRERFMVVVSLDGPPDMHDLHRRTATGKPTWAVVHENLRGFLASYPEYRTNGCIRFNAVVTQATDLVKLQEFWSSCDLSTDSMGVEINEQKQPGNRPMDLWPFDPLAVTAETLYKQFTVGLRSGRFGEEYDHRARWIQRSLFQRPLAIFHKRGYLTPHLPRTMRFLNTCIPGVRRAFVSASGEYFACERVAPSPEQSIGNIRSGISLEKVMSLLADWARAGGDQCRYCWCVSHCSMGCFATMEGDGPITEEGKRIGCARYRRHMDRLLRAYVGILEANPRALDYTAKFQFT
jgi:uncharacterized protein